MDWSTETTYPASAIVKGSDGNLYKAVITQAGNDPVGDSGTNWTLFSNLYENGRTVVDRLNDVVTVVGSDDGSIDTPALIDALENATSRLRLIGTFVIDGAEDSRVRNTDQLSQQNGDGAYPVFPAAAIPIENKIGLQIDASNATFKVVNGWGGFIGYRCIGVEFRGGRFLYADGDTPVFTQEPFPVMFTRCYGCLITFVDSRTFHRGPTIYRCSISATYRCMSLDCNYFGFYTSSLTDIEFDGMFKTGMDKNAIVECQSKGSGTANFFADNAIVTRCLSLDPNIAGGVSTQGAGHYNSQFGFATFEYNQCKETRNIETEYVGPGTIYSSGFNYGFSAGGTLGQIVRDIIIRNNRIDGCKNAIITGDTTRTIIQGNEVQNYWMNCVNLEGADTTQNVEISGNYFRNRDPSSTAPPTQGDQKRGGISIDADATVTDMSGILISRNVIDVDPADSAMNINTNVGEVNITDDNIIRNGSLFLQLPRTTNSIFTGKIVQQQIAVSGGTDPSPVVLSVQDSGKTITGTGYVELPPVSGLEGLGGKVYFDIFPFGNGTLSVKADGNFNYRVEGSNSLQVNSTGVFTLSGAQAARFVIDDATISVFYFNLN